MEEVLSLKPHVLEILQIGVLVMEVHQIILLSILKTFPLPLRGRGRKIKEKFTKS